MGNADLLEIHAILAAPGDCPPVKDNDTLIVKRLKMLCQQMNSIKLVGRAQWDDGRRCLQVVGLTHEGAELALKTRGRIDLFAIVKESECAALADC